MIADELRRQADVFTDLVELQSQAPAAIHPSAPPREHVITRRNSCSARPHGAERADDDEFDD